ncbi:MAG: hypothetical protein JXA94_04625 [Parachlamydiales bacterium]|nr:hypothetical protein [Parachlamydiales bacterium]
MSVVNIDKIPCLNTENLDLNQINNLLNASEVKITKTGKRYLLYKKNYYTIKEPSVFYKTSLENISNTVIKSLIECPITLISKNDNSSFLEKINSKDNAILEEHKNNIESAKKIVARLQSFDEKTRKMIKEANIITRIFFFFRTLFSRMFSNNMNKIKELLYLHEIVIANKEQYLDRFSSHQTASSLIKIASIPLALISMGLLSNVPYLKYFVHPIPLIPMFLMGPLMAKLSTI